MTRIWGGRNGLASEWARAGCYRHVARMMAVFALLCGNALAFDAAGVTLVEVFTNKNCPNCPANEKRMMEMARENPRLLVIFAHVDYWDAKARTPDPWSLPEATERQYDYSNTLGRRPGEVYTPQPILDGRVATPPPFFLNWEKGYAAALAAPAKATLPVATADGGGLTVGLPAAMRDGDKFALWLLGVKQDAGSPVWHLTGLSAIELDGGAAAHIGKGAVPAGEAVIAVLQEVGPGAVVGLGIRD